MSSPVPLLQAQGYTPTPGTSRKPLRRASVAAGNVANERFDILFIGDSLPSGQGQTKRANLYPNIFANYLDKRFPTPSVSGASVNVGSCPAVYAGNAGPFTDIQVATAGAVTAEAVGGFGPDASSCLMTGAGQSVTWTFTGTAFDLNACNVSLGGAAHFKLTIDGTQYQWTGAAPLPNLAIGATNIASVFGVTASARYGIRGLANAAHTVVASWVDGIAIVNGCEPYAVDAAATTGIHLTTACVSGNGTNTFVGGAFEAWLTANIGITYFPDLIIMDSTDDDQTGSSISCISSAQHLINLRRIISLIKAGIAARTDGGLVYMPSFVMTPIHSGNTPVGTALGAGVFVQEPIQNYWRNMQTIVNTDPDTAVTMWDMRTLVTPTGIVPYPLSNVEDGMLVTADDIHYTDAGAAFAGTWLAEQFIGGR